MIMIKKDKNEPENHVDKLEKYTSESIVKRLEDMVHSTPDDEKLVCVMYDGRLEYTAPPVLMAVCMKQYHLAKDLVEAGYATTCLWSDRTIQSAHGVCEVSMRSIEEYEEWLGTCESFFINLSQMIMGAPDMPDDIRLFLWEKIKEEKELHWKEYGQTGYVWDVDNNSRSEKIDGIVGFGEDIMPHDKQLIFEAQFMKTLELFATKKPEYLTEFIRSELQFIIKKIHSPFTRDLILFLCKRVAHIDQQKIELLYTYMGLVKGGRDLGYGNDTFRYHWVNLYCKMEKYYNNPMLKEEFYGCLIKEVLKVCQYVHGRREYLSTEEKYAECCLLDLIKKVQPPNLSYQEFSDYVFRFALEEDIERNYYLEEHWANCVLNQIGRWEEYTIYLYNYLYESDMKLLLKDKNEKRPYDLSEQEQRKIAKEGMERWLNLVSEFFFDEEKELHKRQWVMLYCKDEKLLWKACSKGMFRGKHVSIALDFCVENDEYRKLIPCLLSFRENFMVDEVE